MAYLSKNMTVSEIKEAMSFILHSLRNNHQLTVTQKNKTIALVAQAYGWVEAY